MLFFAIICCVITAFSELWIVFDGERVNKRKTTLHATFTIIVPVVISIICLGECSSGFFWLVSLLFVSSFFELFFFRKEISAYYLGSNKGKKGIDPFLVYLFFVMPLLNAFFIVSTKISLKQIDPNRVNVVFKWILNYLDCPLVVIGVYAGIKMFEPVKKLDNTVRTSKQYGLMKTIQYTKIALLPLTCLAFLLVQSLREFATKSQLPSWEALLYCALAVIIISVLFLIIELIPKRCRGMIFAITSYVCIILFLVKTIELYKTFTIDTEIRWVWDGITDGRIGRGVIVGFIWISALLAQIAGSSLMLRLTFFSNTYSIRGYNWFQRKPLAQYSNWTSWVIFGGNALVSLLSIRALLPSYHMEIDIPYHISVVMLVFVSFVVVPTMTHRLCCEKLPQYSIEILSGEPWIEIAKDGLMSFFVFVLAAIYPIIMLLHIDEGKVTFGKVVLNALCAMFAMFAALVFCCKNNQEHFKAMVARKVVIEDDSALKLLDEEQKKSKYIIVKKEDRDSILEITHMKERMMEQLYIHLYRQSYGAFVACLVYSFVFSLIYAGLTAFRSNTSLLVAYKKMKDEMLPEKTKKRSTKFEDEVRL